METRNILICTALIVLAALTRLLPHPPNFTPIGAMALFAGAKLDNKWKFTIPLGAMILSDIFLGPHATMPFVYGSFLLIIFLGRVLKHKQSAYRLAGVSLVSSVLFFLITNFGVWFSENMYAKNFSGLIDAYVMGLPFFRNTLLGDLFYSYLIF